MDLIKHWQKYLDNSDFFFFAKEYISIALVYCYSSHGVRYTSWMNAWEVFELFIREMLSLYGKM